MVWGIYIPPGGKIWWNLNIFVQTRHIVMGGREMDTGPCGQILYVGVQFSKIITIFGHIGCWPDHSALYTRTSTSWSNKLIDTNAKCRHLKNDLYFDTGKGGGLTRKVRGATVHKAGLKIPTDCLYIQSKNSKKHLPQSPCTGHFFQMTTLCFVVDIVNQSMISIL